MSTKWNASTELKNVSQEEFILMTGAPIPSETPIYDSLVEARVENYRKSWEF